MPRASRPTRAQIDLRAIHQNLRFIQKRVGASTVVMPVVKANAYGHGIQTVSTYLEGKGYGYFGVAYAEEGLQLREAGVRSPIHIFTLANAAQARLVVQHRLEPTLATLQSLRTLRSAAERSRRVVDIHVKVETGMNRIGVSPQDLPRLMAAIGRSRFVRVKAIYTHFAASDEPGSRFTKQQLARFEDALETLHRLGVRPMHVHAANSGAILRNPESYFSMVRPGIMMYGYSPVGEADPIAKIRPAMRFISEISQVKRINAGESVSYGRKFRANRRTVIGTIPVGYADGLLRGLSGKGMVLIRGSRRPMVGRICMDQIMVDCGTLDVRPGTEVVLFGSQGTRTISAWEQAKLVGTIPYELTCAVSARVPREYLS